MEIILYNWTKKDNSTARPTGAGLHVNGTLKTAVSVLAPSVLFENPKLSGTEGTKFATAYNYAYIPELKRYYWITDKVITQTGIISMDMVLDVLATYGDSIKALTCYVSRSASAYNGHFVDGAYATEAVPHIIRNSFGYAPTPIVATNAGYVVSTTSPTGNGVTYWYLTPSNYSKLVEALTNATTLAELMGRDVDENGVCIDLADSVKGITAEMYVAMYNPIQYIRSVVFYPVMPSIDVPTLTTFSIGGITFTGVSAYAMDEITRYGEYGFATPLSVQIPKHPQIADRGDFLTQPPYSQYRLSVPGFGSTDIDGAYLVNSNVLHFRIATDFRDGSATLYVDTDFTKLGEVAQITGKTGITWELGQRAADVSVKGLLSSAVTSAINVAGAAVSSGVDPSSAEYATSHVTSLSEFIKGVKANDAKSSIASGIRLINAMSYMGTTGSMSDMMGDSELTLTYFTLADERNEDIGRPLNAPRTLGNLTGFCMCINPHLLNASATRAEVDAVNDALEAGVELDWGGYE